MKTLLLILVTAAALSACARAEGDFKEVYKAKVFDSCERSLPYRETMTAQRREAFCSCAADNVASRFTEPELRRIDAGPSDPALDQRVDRIFANCSAYTRPLPEISTAGAP